jgi:hypothetical protein
MKARLLLSITLLLLGVALGEVFRPFQALQSHAQSCRTFSETGKQVCGRFLEYWTQNGGLAQQGLPLSNEFSEVSDLNGQTYTVQYFERAVFEKHPENARPFDVLLSQLGTFQFKRKYPSGDPSGGGQPQPTQPAGGAEMRWNGTTSVNTPPFNLQAGTYEATWKITLTSSTCFFGAALRQSNPTPGVLPKEIASGTHNAGSTKSGSTYLYNVPAGQHYLAVNASTGCTWEVTLTKR